MLIVCWHRHKNPVISVYYIFGHPRPNLKDENDNMFVELAIASQSRYLVTSNIKDFVSGELLLNNFQLFTPAQFLKHWRKHHEES